MIKPDVLGPMLIGYFPKINKELSEAKYIRDYSKKNNIDLNLIEELA